jgi:hypothetical protein
MLQAQNSFLERTEKNLAVLKLFCIARMAQSLVQTLDHCDKRKGLADWQALLLKSIAAISAAHLLRIP